MGLSDPVDLMSMQIIDWHFYMAWTSAGDSGVCRWGCFKKSGFGSGGVRLFGLTIRKRYAYTANGLLHALLHDIGHPGGYLGTCASTKPVFWVAGSGVSIVGPRAK